MKTIKFKVNHNREIQKLIYRFEENINRGSIKWIVSVNQFRIKSLHKSNLAVILYFTCLVLLCESCAFTWIGRSVGGDIGKPNFNDYSDTRIIKVSSESINYGGRNHVEVHKTDSSVITGIFKGFTSVPSKKDNTNYNRFIDSISHLAIIPLPGELLLASISNKSGCNITDQFEGFYPSVKNSNKRNDSYPLSPNQMIGLDNSGGTEDNLEKLNNSVKSKRRLLQNGVIILNDKHQKMIIPIGEIAYARCQQSERIGKLFGTAIGILIDFSITLVKSRDMMDDMAMKINF